MTTEDDQILIDCRDVLTKIIQNVCIDETSSDYFFAIDRTGNPRYVFIKEEEKFKVPLPRNYNNRYRTNKILISSLDGDSSDSDEDFNRIMIACRHNRQRMMRMDGLAVFGSDNESDENDQTQRSIISDTNSSSKMSINRKKGPTSIKLPPIELLKITVDENELLKPIAIVESIVDVYVVAHTLPGALNSSKNESYRPSIALDENTVLFTEHRQSLGRIEETFGPIVQPYYLIRFNNDEEIVESGIKIGDSVYYAPTRNDLTNPVFTAQLIKERYVDNDPEDPLADQEVEFSDDEKEKEYLSAMNGHVNQAPPYQRQGQKRKHKNRRSQQHQRNPNDQNDQGFHANYHSRGNWHCPPRYPTQFHMRAPGFSYPLPYRPAQTMQHNMPPSNYWQQPSQPPPHHKE